MTTEQKVKVGDIVKFVDKEGVKRVGVVYETGELFSRVEAYIGIAKVRNLPTATFQPATHLDLKSYVEKEKKAQTTEAILAALNPAAIIGREKKEHSEAVEKESDEAEGY